MTRATSTPLRVAVFTRYAQLGASSRLRLMQFVPALRSLGVACEVHPLLDDDYIKAKLSTGTPWWHVARLYARRVAQCFKGTGHADVIWIEKELWPFLPALVETPWFRRPVVLDFDDAIFHNYDLHPSALVRAALGRKIDALMHRAAIVTAGNEYLAQRAHAAAARRVEWLPTVVDTDRYPAAPERCGGGPFVVGWIGSPTTAPALDLIAEPLGALAAERDVVLKVVGAQVQMPGVRVETLPWTEANEATLVASMDVGVMPLPDTPWARGKCGYKLIQYMACGVPVVASAVSANREIVIPGANGYLASSGQEWLEAMRRLASDPALRRDLGRQGRERVRTRYSLQVAAPRLAGWLQEAAAALPALGQY